MAWDASRNPEAGGRDMGGSGAGTFGFADGGVVTAAALVVHAERVALALLHRVEALIAATLAGLCKGHRARKEHRGVKANVVTSRLRGPNMDTHPRGLWGRRSPLPPPHAATVPDLCRTTLGGIHPGLPRRHAVPPHQLHPRAASGAGAHLQQHGPERAGPAPGQAAAASWWAAGSAALLRLSGLESGRRRGPSIRCLLSLPRPGKTNRARSTRREKGQRRSLPLPARPRSPSSPRRAKGKALGYAVLEQHCFGEDLGISDFLNGGQAGSRSGKPQGRQARDGAAATAAPTEQGPGVSGRVAEGKPRAFSLR